MSGLLKNAAFKGQVGKLSKAVLALCLLDSERPVQRKASIQSCLALMAPDLLTVRSKLAMLHATDLIPGVLSLIIRLEVEPVLSQRLDQTSPRGLFQHKLCCDSATIVQRRNDKQKSKS